MFVYVAALLMAVVLMILLYPLWRSPKRALLMGNEAMRDEERVSRSFEKENLLRSLSQLEIDYTQGKLNADDYHRFKLAEEHRLLNIIDPIDTPTDHSAVSQGAPPVKRLWGLIIAIGIWIVAGTVGIKSFVYDKISADQSASSNSVPDTATSGPAGMSPINPEEMVARLKARLDKDPNDVKGQMMLGRSYMVMERWQEAETAWRKVIELDERSSMGHASLGEILLRSHPPGDTQIAKEALDHFDKALIGTPQNPSILWARGIALIALNRPAEADAAWTEAYQMITPGTEESEMLKNALAALRSGKIPGT